LKWRCFVIVPVPRRSCAGLGVAGSGNFERLGCV
jgi:hypothetical protein